jgi:hypothetical protein
VRRLRLTATFRVRRTAVWRIRLIADLMIGTRVEYSV